MGNPWILALVALVVIVLAWWWWRSREHKEKYAGQAWIPWAQRPKGVSGLRWAIDRAEGSSPYAINQSVSQRDRAEFRRLEREAGAPQ